MPSIKHFILSAMLCASLTAAQAQQTHGFPYPAVPDTLRTPDTRAAWLVRHYWDGFNFADTAFLARPEEAEQGFVNFIDLLPRVRQTVAADGLRQFADNIYKGGAASVREYFATLADSYLGDETSAMHDDVLYAQFLDVMGANKFASIAERTRNEYMARNLRKNLPGSKAADFDYTDRQGRRHSLHDFKARYTLLYFYDPDCRHCRQTLERLRDIPQLTLGTYVRVLAIYPYGYDDRWAAADTHFPAEWTDGYSTGGDIHTHDIYYIKSMPSIYLLDNEKTVILKNPDLSVLGKALNEISE